MSKHWNRNAKSAREKRREEERKKAHDDVMQKKIEAMGNPFMPERSSFNNCLFNADVEFRLAQEEAKVNNSIFKKIEKNGITVEDLDKKYRIGLKEGISIGKMQTIKMCYAAICLSLKENFGFGTKRCLKTLLDVDKHIMYDLSTYDAIERVWDEIGLQINFNEDFDDRIEEKEK